MFILQSFRQLYKTTLLSLVSVTILPFYRVVFGCATTGKEVVLKGRKYGGLWHKEITV